MGRKGLDSPHLLIAAGYYAFGKRVGSGFKDGARLK